MTSNFRSLAGRFLSATALVALVATAPAAIARANSIADVDAWSPAAGSAALGSGISRADIEKPASIGLRLADNSTDDGPDDDHGSGQFDGSDDGADHDAQDDAEGDDDGPDHDSGEHDGGDHDGGDHDGGDHDGGDGGDGGGDD